MLNRKNLSILLVLALMIGTIFTGCGAQPPAPPPPAPVEQPAEQPSASLDYARPEMLISADELQAIIDDPDVRILDVRQPAKYVLGHIPNAINIWRPDYEAPESDYGFGGMLCDKEQWEELMGKLGISNDSRVIMYDDRGLYDGARIWWALYGYGHDENKIQILNGGIDGWQAAGGSSTLRQPSFEATTYTAKDFNMDYYATLDEVIAAVDDPGTIIIDTRAEKEYLGEEQLSGAFRKGRIPNVYWMEWDQNLQEDKTVKSPEDLIAQYKEAGVEQDTPVITYCQSGVRSAVTLFTLRLLGYDNVQNYDGSWIEWSYNQDLPIE